MAARRKRDGELDQMLENYIRRGQELIGQTKRLLKQSRVLMDRELLKRSSGKQVPSPRG